MLNKTDTTQNSILDQEQFVTWFRSVAPYIHSHRGSVMVIHLSGELMQSEQLDSTIHDIALLNSLGIKLVLTFGARPQIEKKLSEQNIESHYVQGLRVTDFESLQFIQEAVGSLQIKLMSKLSMKLPNSPMEGARIQASTGNYVTAKPAGVIEGTDLLYTGHVRNVDVDAITNQFNQGDIVIIPPVGYSITGELFDISALEIASQIAIELKAQKLCFIFPYQGIQNKDGELLRQLTQTQAEKILIASGERDQSPYAELEHAILACKHNVERVHLIDQNNDGSLLQELFTRDGIGTLISQTPFDEIRKATSEDIPGILELINPLQDDGVLIKRSQEHLELEINDYTVMVRDGAVIACTALHSFANDIAELACLVVHPEYQQQQKGASLLKQIEDEAKEQGIKQLFLLTTQTEHWFIEKGFQESSFESLPIEKQEFYNYSRNSKVFIKEL